MPPLPALPIRLPTAPAGHHPANRGVQTQSTPPAVWHTPVGLARCAGSGSYRDRVLLIFPQGVATVRLPWKHSRHNTGRPWVGLNGTVVSLPQLEQVVRVSTLE
jgi:hypothetical protein